MEVQRAELEAKLPEILQELSKEATGAGYVVVRGMLSKADVAIAHRIVNGSLPVWLSRVAKTTSSRRTFDLVSRGAVFGKMLDDDALNKVLLGICGEGVKCGSYHANTVPPEAGASRRRRADGKFLEADDLAQMLHIDYPYGNHAPGLSENPPRDAHPTCQVLWMLDDFTELNGATVIVPNSHRLWRSPDRSKGKDNQDLAHAIDQHVRVTGNAGDALIYPGNLWHAVPKNLSNATRTAVLGQFLPYYVVSMEAHAVSTPHSVLKALPPRARALMTEHVRPANLWVWNFVPWTSLVRKVVDVSTSYSGAAVALPTACGVLLACRRQIAAKELAVVGVAAAASFFAGIVACLFYRDLEQPFTAYSQVDPESTLRRL